MRSVIRWIVFWLGYYLKLFPKCQFCGVWIPCTPNCMADSHCHTDCLKKERRRRWKERAGNTHARSRIDLN